MNLLPGPLARKRLSAVAPLFTSADQHGFNAGVAIARPGTPNPIAIQLFNSALFLQFFKVASRPFIQLIYKLANRFVDILL